MSQRPIATVSLSGTLDERLRTIAGIERMPAFARPHESPSSADAAPLTTRRHRKNRVIK